jgi:hypothetical protein
MIDQQDPSLPTSARGPSPQAVPAAWIRNIPTGSAQQQAAEDIAVVLRLPCFLFVSHCSELFFVELINRYDD